jgi:hypothetical protein
VLITTYKTLFAVCGKSNINQSSPFIRRVLATHTTDWLPDAQMTCRMPVSSSNIWHVVSRFGAMDASSAHQRFAEQADAAHKPTQCHRHRLSCAALQTTFEQPETKSKHHQ